jgi:hypothetical protein
MVLGLGVSVAQAQEKPADNMALVRDKIRTDKKLLVGTNMALTETEAKAFWPVYEAYQADLGKLNQRTVKLVKDYAASYKSMTDAVQAPSPTSDRDRARPRCLLVYRPKFARCCRPRGRALLPDRKQDPAVINYELADAIPIM